MPDKKSLDQLCLEKERAELRLAQEQRRLTRLENRKQYYEKGERAKRTHELMTLPLTSCLPGRTPPRPWARPHRRKCSFWNCLQTESVCRAQSWKRRSMSVEFPHAPWERQRAVSGTGLWPRKTAQHGSAISETDNRNTASVAKTARFL